MPFSQCRREFAAIWEQLKEEEATVKRFKLSAGNEAVRSLKDRPGVLLPHR